MALNDHRLAATLQASAPSNRRVPSGGNAEAVRRLLEDLAAAGYPLQSGLIRPEDLPPRPHYLPRALSLEEDQRLQQELRRAHDLFSQALLLGH